MARADPPSDEACRAAEAVAHLLGSRPAPRVGLILGSGLGGLPEHLVDLVEIGAQDVVGLPRTTVPGHSGTLAYGRLGEVPVLASVGRCHVYEGRPIEEVVFVLHLFAALGAELVVAMSAAGGISPDHVPGDLMLVSDHLNLMGESPLRPRAGRPPTFLDLTDCYDARLRERVRRVASDLAIPLHEGVLAAVRGPHFETPAEVRMLRTLGADAVCMSLVPEAIAARALGMGVLGLAVVANRAAGLASETIDHDDVLRRVQARTDDVARLLAHVLGESRGA